MDDREEYMDLVEDKLDWPVSKQMKWFASRAIVPPNQVLEKWAESVLELEADLRIWQRAALENAPGD